MSVPAISGERSRAGMREPAELRKRVQDELAAFFDRSEAAFTSPPALLQVFQLLTLILDLEHAQTVKHKAYRAAGAQGAAFLIEVHPQVGYGARWVISGRFHHYGNPMGGISFIYHLFIIGLVLAHSPFDSRFHPVLGHVHALGVRHTTA